MSNDTVTYAIGDVHGRADLLGRMFRLIASDAHARRIIAPVVGALGDYIDRGPTSRQAVDLLLANPLGFRLKPLLGNHEHLLLQALEVRDQGGAAQGAAIGWLRNGAMATLESYGATLGSLGIADVCRDFGLWQRSVRRLIGPTHLHFLQSLALHYATADCLFIHAGLRPGVDLAAQDIEDMLWIREDFLRSDADHGRLVIHGHTIEDENAPSTQSNRVNIDTGAYRSGRLTCAVCTGRQIEFITTAALSTQAAA